ncbi:MAG: hypothetical protein LBC39_02295 [Methanobrevibacter sp.]|nr:hypothetical protein [Candidatus Methanovirga aequatorialis]
MLHENFKGEDKLEIMKFLKELAVSSMGIVQDDTLDMDFSIMENHPVHDFPHFRHHFNFRRFR